jgi:general secretion pathway protein D
MRNKKKSHALSRIAGVALVTLAAAGAAHSQFDMFDQEPPKPAWEQFPLDAKARVTLDFRNASVDAILQMLSKASGVAIVKDPGLTGGLTLQSPRPVSLDEAFALFNAVLGLKNFELQKQGTFLIIKPKQARGFGGGRSFGGATGGAGGFGGNQSQLRVYPIKFANASQVARVINEVFATPSTPPGQNTPGQTPGGGGPGGGGGNPFNFGRRGGFGGGGGGFGGGRFGGGRGAGAATTATVKASADDYSNSVIVNASSRDQTQVASIIRELDKRTDEPQRSEVYPLKFAAAADLAPVIQNVLVSNAPRGRGGIGTQNVPIDQRFQQAARFGSAQAAFGQVAADTRTNSLIVTATPDNLDVIKKVIQQLDTPVPYVSSTFVVTLANARADNVAQLLNQAFNTRNGSTANFSLTGSRTTTNTNTLNNNNRNTNPGNNRPATLGGRAVPAPTGAGATGAAGTPAGDGVSAAGGGDAGATRAAAQPGVTPDGKYLSLAMANPGAEAGELATNVSVQQGFGFGGGGGQFGGGRFGQQTQQRGQTATDSQGRIVNVQDMSGDVTAIPDINTNSVIVVTSPQNQAILQQILEQLDKIPEQVMIETLIVEASLDAASKLGVEWSIAQGKVFGNPNVKSNTSQSFGLQTDTSQPQGFRYTLTGTQFTAFVQAVQTDTRFNVLSTPRIFTSNNSTAEINISQSLPYVISQQSDTNGNIFYNYSFLDVGIILTVTPRITSNGYVTMDVTQTANDFVGYTSFNAPIVNQREADTTVSVQDGQTIVLGGIIENTISTTVNKIPVLGDIPILGELFKSTKKDNNKTELLVFLTPHVVRDSQEAQKLRSSTEQLLQPKTRDQLDEARKMVEPSPPNAVPPNSVPPNSTPTNPAPNTQNPAPPPAPEPAPAPNPPATTPKPDL